jgi:stearoyl-CoA desaturase (delta-9 desaturase)
MTRKAVSSRILPRRDKFTANQEEKGIKKMAIVSRQENKTRNRKTSSKFVETEGIESIDNEALAGSTEITPELFGGHLPVGEYVSENEIDAELALAQHHRTGHQSRADRIMVLGATIIPLIGMIACILMAFAFNMVTWLDVTMMIGGWYLTGLGITIGFHRMLTHGSFKAVKPVKFLWTALGTMALEGSPLDWCMVHRRHHQFSDVHGDPHSPHLHGEGWWNAIKGFYHSHFGWMLTDAMAADERQKYVPDLAQDKMLQFFDRTFLWWTVASLTIPGIIGALAAPFFYGTSALMILKGFGLGLLWGGLARVCLSHHMTWSINSICHVFGSQDFKSADDSRNNVVFGVLSHGEGWHNNHHAFPTSARHGLKWWQFDLSWVIIRALSMVGLVWDVRLPTERQLKMRAIDKSQGAHLH